MENCGGFVFYNKIYFFTKNQKQIKQPELRDMLRYFHGLSPHSP